MAALVETSEEDDTVSVARFTAEMAWADAGPEDNIANVIKTVQSAKAAGGIPQALQGVTVC